mmetsp:Transcript_341/g.1443  ORF Transcript_341/g.1443 Transcript_341/m.1443 type:complete len:114 (-) Transcript_341:48-389(-)
MHAPRSKSWYFLEDPVPGLASERARDVVNHYMSDAGGVVKFMKWIKPKAYEKMTNYLGEVWDVASTFEPVITEEHLSLPTQSASRREKFDASVHPQVNYTEALCRRWLTRGLD